MASPKFVELAGWRVQLVDRLTVKEGEAIALAAAGKTAKEAARVLGISPDTVKDRWLNARDKLGYLSSLRELLLQAALLTEWLRGTRNERRYKILAGNVRFASCRGGLLSADF